ncbi:reverse transcriptase (RNA-dependent DNA polymerase) [Hirsutella rhossiliensis]
MDGEPFIADVRVNGTDFVPSLVDYGCLCYGAVSKRTFHSLQLPHIRVQPRILENAAGDGKEVKIDKITYVSIDLDGHQQHRVFMYVIDDLNWDMILGKRWMEDQDVHIHAKEGYLEIGSSGVQRYINSALQDYLDDFVSAYIDDVLIFSSGSLQDHRDKVGKVLQRLMDAGLQLDINKSEFEVKAVKYLGFIIEAECGIRVDPEKVEAVKGWATPTNVKSVRSFIGFANFYRIFMPDFSVIAEPLTRLTKKDVPFRWDGLCDEAFEKLKDLLITAPILAHFHPERETILEADASGFASGGVLLQRDDKGGLVRPVAYFSKKHSAAEANYAIHDKELLAILRCLEQWEPELRAVEHFKILTDHKNLRYFYSERRLTERQVRWSEFLSRFQFELEWRPGRKGGLPDALSTGPGYAGQPL